MPRISPLSIHCTNFVSTMRIAVSHLRPASTSSAFNPSKLPESKNVLNTPLKLHSLTPLTGYFRNGFCDVDSRDPGNHSVAALLSDSFLNFSASRGNNLRSPPPSGPGLESGCRWCLCVSRWKEALEAYRRGEVERDAVPRVVLEATNMEALREVDVEELREFAVEEGGIWEVGEREVGGDVEVEGTRRSGEGRVRGVRGRGEGEALD